MDYLDYEDYGEFEFDDKAMFDFEDEEFDMELEDETGPLVRRLIQTEKKKVAAKPTPKAVAKAAAKVAGAAVGKGKGAKIALKAAKKTERDGEMDFEGDFEADAEAMLEASPEAQELFEQMEMYAEMAAEAESEAEADQWLGAVASLAGPLISSLLKESDGETDLYDEDYEGYDEEADEFFGLIAKAIPKIAKFAAPLVKKGIGAVGKLLRSKRTRSFARRLPRMALNTAASVAQRAASGRSVTPGYIAATLGRNAYQTYARPSYRYSQYRSPRRRRRAAARRRTPRNYSQYN